ncbi:MAG: hypothetical protein WDM86_12415 [Rhizomicrobium sp.]
MSNDFELSRIYAEGWNAAWKLSPAQASVLEKRGMAALNPYAVGREHDRWSEGFGRALGASPKTAARGAPGRWGARR